MVVAMVEEVVVAAAAVEEVVVAAAAVEEAVEEAVGVGVVGAAVKYEDE
jgi:hypothetical protein